MAAVLDGRRLYARRADLEKVIEPGDECRRAVIAERVAGREEACAAERDGDADACSRRDVESAIDMAGRVAGGHGLSDDDLVAMACALTDIRVRDTLYALAVGECADAAESLWAALSRALPDPWRAEALGLLAFSAYARGDGPLAGVA